MRFQGNTVIYVQIEEGPDHTEGGPKRRVVQARKRANENGRPKRVRKLEKYASKLNLGRRVREYYSKP